MWTLFGFFFGTLLICACLVKFKPRLALAMDYLAQRYSRKTFPVTSPLEYNKFALLRIFLGMVLLVRGLNVYILLLESELFSAVGLWAAAETISGAMLVVGIATQWVLVFLVGAMWQYGDLVVGKSTLGNDVGAILATFLFLVNGGKYLSLDNVLLKRLPLLHWAMLYYRGAPNSNQVFYAKSAALASYWAICVYSVSIHLNEPAWMDGSAGPLLLSNNFMSLWHGSFAALFSSSELAVSMAKGSLWLMILWYPVVLPFVFLGGIFRKYVIVWGWLFFALSFFVLQLGYLAEIEAILWLALFWSFTGMDRKQSMEVLYDDRCNLCDRTVQAITLLDVFGRITLRPLSQSKPLLEEIGLDMKQVLTDLYGVRCLDRRLFRGYDFYVQLARTLVLLWPILPLLLIGRFLWIGPRVYRFIAERRTRMFGVCEMPRRKFIRQIDSELSSSLFPQTVTLHMGALILFYFVAVPAPYLGWRGVSNVGADAAHIYGIAPINVFNKSDLRMAENWFVLSSIDFGELLPVLSQDGSRLSMHTSDRIYFGHTLRFRRSIIGNSGCQFEAWKPMFEYLSSIYLQLRQAPAGNYRFTYRQFHQPLVSVDNILRNQYKPTEVQKLCELNYDVTYQR